MKKISKNQNVKVDNKSEDKIALIKTALKCANALDELNLKKEANLLTKIAIDLIASN